LHKEPPELNITTFLNLMVVLVPFLLITAVFSRIAILELNVPNLDGAVDQQADPVAIIVRADKLEVDDGRKVLTTIAKVDKGYDFAQLTEVIRKIKDKHPGQTDAIILMEPDLAYDYLVQTMDAVRSVHLREADGKNIKTVELFPNISIGDAYRKN